MKGKILLVDDDANLLASLNRQLRRHYPVDVAEGGQQALFSIQTHGPYAVVVCDMRMPGMDGVQVLRKIRDLSPNTVRIMLTGNADQQTAMDAVNEGAIFRFFNKPCSTETLCKGLDAALEQYRLLTAEKELLEKTLSGSIKLLMDVLSLVAPEAYGQATRMRDWVHRLITEWNLPSRWQLELATMLSAIGHVTIPTEITQKMADGVILSPIEEGIVVHAPEAARKLIGNIPRLSVVASIVALQNRGYDGSGFPVDAPKGDALPLDARLLYLIKDVARVCGEKEPSAATFRTLEAHKERYDPILFRKVRDAMSRWNNTPELSDIEREEVKISGLTADQVLAENMELENGHMILAAGARLNVALIERIHNLAKIHPIKQPIVIIQPWVMRAHQAGAIAGVTPAVAAGTGVSPSGNN